MTVTRYKRNPQSSDLIKRAVMGVIGADGKRSAVEAPVAPTAQAAKPAEPKPPMRISREVMARARSQRRQGQSAGSVAQVRDYFKAYEPPPGVLPKDADAKMALDAGLETWAQTSFTNAWNFSNPFGDLFAEGIGFLGFAYLAQLTQRPEYRRISERIATEMTRKWIRLTIAGEADPEDADDLDDDDADTIAHDKAKAPDAPLDEEDEDEDDAVSGEEDAEQDDEPTPEEKAQRERNKKLQKKIRKIEEDMKRLDVRGKFKLIAEYDGWMGRSHLYIDNGAGDDDEELKTDLGNGSDETSKSKFKKGSLRALKHIEAMWCYPLWYNAQNPLSDEWYNPQLWFAMAKQIHVSRLLLFVGRPLPDILKPSYAFAGLSMSQMAKPYVDNWLRTRQAVTQLIESFSVSGVYTNAQSILQGGGEEVLERIDLFNITRTNSGCLVLDKDLEEFFNISTPLGTLDALQAQSQEQMSSVSGIPLIVLLGITPTGLNASSEGELRVFYDMIHAMQESLFRDKLKRVIDFVQLNLFGEVDPAISFEFEPLWSLDEKGEAEVRKIKAETHQLYVDMGVAGQDEVRKIEIDDDDSPYNSLDPDELPEPPAEAGVLGPGAGGAAKEFEAERGGGETPDRTMGEDSIHPELLPTEVAEDVFAFDEGQFDESKHKRDSDGKFATTGSSGAAAAVKEVLQSFKTKKEHIGHLLTKGTTPKEVMMAMGWPSVSMQAQAKSLGMKLEKYTEGGVTKYKGTPMTEAEKKAAKEEAVGKQTDAQAQQILKNAGLGKEPTKGEYKVDEDVAPTNYGEFLKHVEHYNAKGDKTTLGLLLKYNPDWATMFAEKIGAKKPESASKPTAPAKAAPAAAKLTDEQIKKAGKGTAVSLNLIAGEKPSIAGSPQMKGVEAQIKAFNDKYAGKQLNDAKELAEKVEAYKNLAAYTNAAAKEESANKAKIEKQVKEKEAAEEAERQAKKKAELDAKFAADPDLKIHHEAMEALFGGEGATEKYLKNAMSKVKAAGLKDYIGAADAVPIIAYSGSHYGAVNSQLRSGTMTLAQAKFTKSLNAGLEKLPKYAGKTYRKASLSPEQFAAYKPGHVVEERGFTSTSKNQGTWSGAYDYTIHGKSGRDIQKLSSHPSEAEVLFKSGTRFLVKSVKGNHIELEEF